MKLRYTGVAMLGAALLLAGIAQAQPVAASDLAGALDIVDTRPANPSVNTALVFTNPKDGAARVRLRVFNYEGEQVGEGELHVPPNGLRYVFVSQLLRDGSLPFVGWVAAKSSPAVFSTAVLLGVGTTDLPVDARRTGRIFFRLAAAY